MTRQHRLLGRIVFAALAMTSVAGGQTNAAGGAVHATVRVSGVVVTAEDMPQRVRRAIVSLSGGRSLGYHTITDDEGRFAFDAVPVGRYELSAARKGFVTIAFGAARPGRPGTTLVLELGQPVANLRVLLARGAVITGTVRDLSGEPVSDLEVRVERRVGSTPSGPVATTVVTDDRGGYRAFGLTPGTYVVSTRPPPLGSGELSAPSDAEVDAALAALQRRQEAQVIRPPGQTPYSDNRLNVSVSPQYSDVVAVYHPGVFAPEDAGAVVVRAGEERAGVDITVRVMSTAVVSGRVAGIDGRIPDHLRVSLTRPGTQASGQVRSDGTFEFPSVSPGRYQLAAQAVPQEILREWLGFAPSGRASRTPGACVFAADELSVMGVDLTGLSLLLRPCLRIVGRLEFAGTTPAPSAKLSGARITLQAAASADATTQGLTPRLRSVVGAGGRFELGAAGEILPGVYLLQVELPDDERARGWRLDTATADGLDILDAPLKLSGSSPEVTTVVLTFTNRETSLSGLLETAPGRPAIDHTILAFSTNRDWWRAPYRRVRTARPDTKGEYRFSDLPPGEYFLVALTDLAPDDWRDPMFLDGAASQALRVMIAPGRAVIQHLRVAGGFPIS